MDGRSPGILWADWISLHQDIHSRFDGLDLSDEKPQRLSLQGENGPGWHWLRVKLQREAWAQVRGVRLKPFLSNKGGLPRKLRRMDGAAVDVREAGCGGVRGLHFTDTLTTRGVSADFWWLKSVMGGWHEGPRKRLFCSHAASHSVHFIKYFCFFHTLFEFVKIFSLSKFILNHLFNQLLM